MLQHSILLQARLITATSLVDRLWPMLASEIISQICDRMHDIIARALGASDEDIFVGATAWFEDHQASLAKATASVLTAVLSRGPISDTASVRETVTIVLDAMRAEGG